MYFPRGESMLSFPVKPMLLQSSEKPFDSSKHIFEWKVDGIRCITFYDHGKVRLQSRSGKDCTRAFPELGEPPVMAKAAILDGEITVFTNGKPDFEAVTERYLASPKKVALLVNTKPAVYIVWDILWYNEKSVMNLSLMERKEILDQAVENNGKVIKIDWVDTDGVALWEAVKAQGLEGMVAKKKGSRYTPGQRAKVWLKVKNYQKITVNVLGYSRKDGTLLVGTNNNVQGHAIGMRGKDREVLRKLLDTYGKTRGEVVLLPPGIKGQVKFTTWTPRGNMRDCSWVSFEK